MLDIKNIDNQIDEEVYDLYGITEEEKRVIENDWTWKKYKKI